MERRIVEAKDGYILNVHVFDAKNRKGVVQILHGMEEHQERYEPLARYLASKGYAVVTSNLRGHGEDAPELGFFKEKKGDELLIDDQKRITKFIKERFQTEKVIILAHSMGSIIARNLMKTESKGYSKVVLLGYPCPNEGVGLGYFLMKAVELFRGPHYLSKSLCNTSLKHFNKYIKSPRTLYDWISCNEKNVDDFVNDPYCGHGFKVSALGDLFVLMRRMSSPKNYRDVDSSLPILALRGEDDPCAGYDKGSAKSISILKKAGFTNIKYVKYQGMRHEILNEERKMDVYQDILAFLDE